MQGPHVCILTYHAVDPSMCNTNSCVLYVTYYGVNVSDKSLKDTLDKVLLSGYFDRAQTHQNGTCEDEVEREEQTVVAESKSGMQPSEPGI